MTASEIAIGLDIGTTKIVAIIGCRNEYGKLEVVGKGQAKSLGVQRGVVSNISQTIESIQAAVQEAEVSSGISIDNVVVGIAGQHIRSLQHSDYITRRESEEVIDSEDIDSLIDNVHKLVMLPGEEIIHVLPQEYKVDGEAAIREPKGMFGVRLEANFHIVVGQVTAIRNIGRCITKSGLSVAGITLEPLASAEAVLSGEEKEAGVVLVDIGGGTTDVAIFKDGIIRHTAVIPFGGNIITEDIKEGCTIIEKQAEMLKLKFGSAWPGENSENEIVAIPGLRGREPKEISLKNLSRIIHARVVEIIDQVHMEIKNYGYEEDKKKLIAGIVLTGGGAQLKHIKQLVEYETGMDTRIGYPNEHLAKGADEKLSSPMYATAIGLVMKGLEINESQPKQDEAVVEAGPSPSPIDVPIEEMQQKLDEHKKGVEQAELDGQVENKEEEEQKESKPFFDKWADKFIRFLANDD